MGFSLYFNILFYQDGDDDMSIMVTLGAESNTKIRVDTGFSPSVKVVDYKSEYTLLIR